MKTLLRSTLYGIRSLLDPLIQFREVAILCYHSVSEARTSSISPLEFENQLQVLTKAGYVFVALKDVVAWQASKGDMVPLPRKAVALTFDDGYTDFLTTALPILERHRAPASLFVIGDREAYRRSFDISLPMLSDSELSYLARHPLIEIGWHTRTHPDLRKLTREMLVQECIPPSAMRFFAYPGGNYTDTALEIVREHFPAAFSIKRDVVHRGQNRWLLPRVVVCADDRPEQLLQYVSVAQGWYAWLRRQSRYA